MATHILQRRDVIRHVTSLLGAQQHDTTNALNGLKNDGNDNAIIDRWWTLIWRQLFAKMRGVVNRSARGSRGQFAVYLLVTFIRNHILSANLAKSERSSNSITGKNFVRRWGNVGEGFVNQKRRLIGIPIAAFV